MEDFKVEVEDKDPINPIIHKGETEEEVDSEVDQEVDKSLTEAPQKGIPEKILETKDADRDRCRYCREIGHWVKDCPQKKRDDEKASEGATGTFSNLSEIAQDFYGTPDVFNGITDIYKENQEDQEGPQEVDTEDPIPPLNF